MTTRVVPFVAALALATAAVPLAYASLAAPAEPAATCADSTDLEAEDRLLDAMRTELLQVDMTWHAKARAGSASLATEEAAPSQRHGSKAEAQAVLELLQLRQKGARASVADEAASTNASDVDCEQYPMFCDPKVNCAGKPVTPAERHSLSRRLATAAGHSNPRGWCLIYPMHAMSLQKCILEQDVAGYAQECYSQQEKLGLVEADAVYCFAANLCNNTEVTEKTTGRQAETICDHSFGHSEWTSTGWKDFQDMMTRSQELLKNYASLNLTDYELWAIARRESRISAMTACAMGNYHCDVFYCKQNFCHSDHWRTKYGNLSWTP